MFWTANHLLPICQDGGVLQAAWKCTGRILMAHSHTIVSVKRKNRDPSVRFFVNIITESQQIKNPFSFISNLVSSVSAWHQFLWLLSLLPAASCQLQADSAYPVPCWWMCRGSRIREGVDSWPVKLPGLGFVISPLCVNWGDLGSNLWCKYKLLWLLDHSFLEKKNHLCLCAWILPFLS